MSAEDIRWIQRFNHFVKSAIRNTYFAEFETLRVKLDELKREEQA